MADAVPSAVQSSEQRSEAGTARALELLDVLELERIEANLLRGRNETVRLPRLFGGQVLAQALVAAGATVETTLPVHSLHGYFLRAGDPERPVLYEVDRIRDGRSFVTRRVVAIQRGDAIFSMSLSFHKTEAGFEHAEPMPNVPPPEELREDAEVVAELPPDTPGPSPMAGQPRPFHYRSVCAPGSEAARQDRRFHPGWLRFRQAVDDRPYLHAALLAYASDMALVSTSTLPHQSTMDRSALQIASLDHAMWFHRDVRVDEWLLFQRHTTSAAGGRGLNHAEVYGRDGGLRVSITQEGLIRPRY
ncbi:MAG: acyl-CoA thioesterase II [Pseudomonadota bacterium]